MLLVQLVAFGIFTASLPDSPVPLSGAVTSSPSWPIAWLVVASVAEGAMAPMVYELSAEARRRPDVHQTLDPALLEPFSLLLMR